MKRECINVEMKNEAVILAKDIFFVSLEYYQSYVFYSKILLNISGQNRGTNFLKIH
ncbi:hypothetical protein M2451_003473 [Dysgonomonas sp. PFB1-18]|nr:hypothetical protein [Dysgonomonas sp. PF1-14]MDH6340459.1 hypothetical protein [Dysgonomonas sp. PF1-16]MDH6382133.1 hypothetical protein [Dysgonomonas sp. PFB1-18]MDH6399477.1 hypothetical protein [Dysgonomonas sp. PF1-23]